MLFVVLASSSCMGIDWEQVEVIDLQRAVLDQGDVLSTSPKDWSAADVSRLCWDRLDWALLVPLFASLWIRVANKWGDELASLVATQDFCDAALQLQEEHGFAAHPSTLIATFGNDVGRWPKRPWATFSPQPRKM